MLGKGLLCRHQCTYRRCYFPKLLIRIIGSSRLQKRQYNENPKTCSNVFHVAVMERVDAFFALLRLI